MGLITLRHSNWDSFISRKKKRLEVLKTAAELSYEDVIEKMAQIIKMPNTKNSLYLIRTLFNSSTWLTKSSFRLIKPVEPTFFEKKKILQSKESRDLLTMIYQGHPIDHKKATYAELFELIFYDYEMSHLDPSHKKISRMPEIKSSMLLVSGVFNEIFSTPAFERGAQYLRKKYGINYDFCPTSGVKSTRANSLQIENHMENLLGHSECPDVWVFAFSKGGLDFLHFLKDFGENYSENIMGLSTVASPILGSERVEHILLKFFSQIHRFDNNFIYHYLDNKFDLFLKGLTQSLSSEYQENWFQENYSFLPQNMFYSALALQSSWYESHIWMILTKIFFQSQSINDGVVDIEKALYPDYFQGINLGIVRGHHLIGTRSSDYVQEALLEAHITLFHYLKLIR